MHGFRKVEVAREQMVLWEHRLEDAIPEDHQVRHVDHLLRSVAFSETFREMECQYDLLEGRPPYHPRDLAGLYLYGMLHRLRSSRQLEDACYSRLDVMWLMRGQTPDHSTIAEFVSRHGKSLRRLFRDALGVLIEAKLVRLAHVAVDGSKVEASAGRGSVRTEEKMLRWQAYLEEQISRLEQAWSENERREADLFGEHNPWTGSPGGKEGKKALAHLRRKQAQLAQALAQLERRRAAHVGRDPLRGIASTTDPDCRSMVDKEGRSKPNYNTQLAVDDGLGVIVAADVNDEPEDSGQLTPMVEQTIEHCGSAPEAVSADSQYNTGCDLAAMESRGIDTYLPDSGQNSESAGMDEGTREALACVREGKALSEAQWDSLPRNAQGTLDRLAFVYDATWDAYRCPAGELLPYLRASRDRKKWGEALRRQYGGSPACATCARASICCPKSSTGRVISRDQYEEHRSRLRSRMDTDVGRGIYKRRKHTVEPRFAHVKQNLGVRRFLRRGLEKVKTEWFMVCTAVNLGVILKHWEEIAKVL